MNLAGRRIQQDFTDNRIPQLQREIAEACPGTEISVNVAWETFEEDSAALENLWLVIEQPKQAIEAVCADELGRQAVADTVRRVSIVNVSSADAVGAEVDGDTLIVRMRCAEAQAGTPGWPEIERVLAAAL